MSLPQIRTVRELPGEAAAIGRLDAIARGTVPDLRAMFLEAIRALVTPNSLARVAVAIERGSLEVAVDAYDWQAFREAVAAFYKRASEAYAAGVVEGWRTVPSSAAAPVPRAEAMTAAQAEAQRWLGGEGAQLIRQVTAETRDGVRRIIGAKFDAPTSIPGAGFSQRRIVDVLKADTVGSMAGLTERQAVALAKKVALIPDSLTAAQRAKRARRLYEMAVQSRAKVIAMTETFNTVNAGKRRAWAQSDLDPMKWEREWVARIVDSCPECIDLDGTRAPLKSGDYTSKSGEIVSPGPTQHPRCVCCERVVPR